MPIVVLPIADAYSIGRNWYWHSYDSFAIPDGTDSSLGRTQSQRKTRDSKEKQLTRTYVVRYN
jgi:hypothetical protein